MTKNISFVSELFIAGLFFVVALIFIYHPEYYHIKETENKVHIATMAILVSAYMVLPIQ